MRSRRHEVDTSTLSHDLRVIKALKQIERMAIDTRVRARVVKWSALPPFQPMTFMCPFTDAMRSPAEDCPHDIDVLCFLQNKWAWCLSHRYTAIEMVAGYHMKEHPITRDLVRVCGDLRSSPASCNIVVCGESFPTFKRWRPQTRFCKHLTGPCSDASQLGKWAKRHRESLIREFDELEAESATDPVRTPEPVITKAPRRRKGRLGILTPMKVAEQPQEPCDEEASLSGTEPCMDMAVRKKDPDGDYCAQEPDTER